MKRMILIFLIALLSVSVSWAAVPIIDGVLSSGEWDSYYVGTSTTAWAGGMSVDVYAFTDGVYLYAAYEADMSQPGWSVAAGLWVPPNLDFWTPSTTSWPDPGYTHISVYGDGFAQTDGSNWNWPDGYGNTAPSVFSSRGIELVIGEPCYNIAPNPNIAEIKIPLSLLTYAGNDGQLGLSGQYWQYDFSPALYVDLPLPPPRDLKEGIRDDLNALLPTGDNKTDERIEKAIEKIDKSLEPDLWEDDSHLTKKGKKVFEEEKKAVHELMKIVDDGGPYVADAQGAIDDLVDVDFTLAQIAIDEAQAACSAEIDPEEQEKCQKEVDKANEEMTKAADELSMGDFDKAIEHYKKAWDHAQKGLKKTMDPLGPGAGELVNDAVPTSFALEHNYPNPFNPETNIQYALPEVSRVVLKIFNVRGQLVRTLVDEIKAAGIYTVRWDGKDSNGLSVPSGVYFYRIGAGEKFVKTNKMMLIK